jgi:hypothetical protein
MNGSGKQQTSGGRPSEGEASRKSFAVAAAIGRDETMNV